LLAQDPEDALPAVLRAHGSRSPAVSVAIALGVAGLLFASGSTLRPPALEGAVLLLFVAVEHEVRTGRIARELAFSALLLVLALSSILAGPAGLGSAVAGAGLSLALLLPVLLLGGIGAGDLLAAMALGGVWGFEMLPGLALWSCAAGLALAALLAVLRALDLRRAPAASTGGGLLLRRPPLAVAVGLGAAALQLWGFPWA
jgi:prepilin signal peptidase PulO-like enzyme (type II secretory pathway)